MKSDLRLRETLTALGVPASVVSASPWEVIEHAEPRLRPMSVTYEAVNAHLASLVADGGLRIDHITGEARALIDTAHRRILRKIGPDRPARLGCYFPYEGRPTAVGLVANQRRYWPYMDWYDLIDMLALAAEGCVAIYVLDRPQPIHYSLFGDQHILLQDRHDHPQPEKTVWYLRSAALVAELDPRVANIFAHSRLIDARSFRAALAWLADYEPSTVLGNLRRGAPPDKGLGADQASEVVVRLTDLGLLDRQPEDRLVLSKLGESWLDARMAS